MSGKSLALLSGKWSHHAEVIALIDEARFPVDLKYTSW